MSHVLAIRWLGAAGYGEFVIAEAIVFALGVVALYGNHLACFALAEQTPPAHPRSLLLEGGRVILTLWSAQALLALAALYLLPQVAVLPGTTVSAGAAAVLGMALYRYVSELLRTSVSPELANYFSGRGTGFASSLLFCVLVALAGLRDGGLRDSGMLLVCHAMAQWIGVTIGLVLLWPALRREAEPGQWLSGSATRAALWLRGRSILVTQGLQLVMGNADVWVLGAVASPQVVGVYGLAKRFANWLVVPAGMIGMAGLKHAVAEFIRAGRVSEGFVREFTGAVRVSWFGTAAIVLAAAVVPSSWIARFGGGEAAGSKVFFVALGVGQLLRLALGNGGLILTAAGFERDNLVAFFWGSVLSLLMAATLVPVFSAWGAVAAFSFGSAGAAFLVSRACRRRMGFDCDLLRARRAS